MVPGEPARKNPILARAAKDKESLYTRIAHRFYFKGHPDAVGRTPNETLSALVYGGEGTGLKRCDALYHLGWSGQMSKIDITTLRRVKSYAPFIVYTKNPNTMRKSLTWNEITLIEAILFITYSELPWHTCLERLANGVSQSRLPWNKLMPFRFRRDLMLDVASQPQDAAWLKTMFPVKGDDLKWRINEACEAANSCEPAQRA